MARLTIYQPDGYAREDTSTESHFLNKIPVDLGIMEISAGIELRFFVSGRKACWWGELVLSHEQAEKLKMEIENLLKSYDGRVILENPLAT